MAKKRQVDDIIDIRFFVFKLINNWYYFLISVLLSLSIAFGINRYSQEIYEASTTLLIKEKTGSMQSAAEMLYDNTYHKDNISKNNTYCDPISCTDIFHAIISKCGRSSNTSFRVTHPSASI